MSRLARTSHRLGWLAAPAVALAGCQSILGFDSNRPLVTDQTSDGGAEGGKTGDAAGGGGDGALGEDTGVVEASGADGNGAIADASDANPPLPDAADSGPSTSFANPLQIDVSALFNANSVVTTAIGGMPLTPMDGNGTSDGNDFPTQSEVAALDAGPGKGLPDDAFFPSNGTTIPAVQLAWTNASNRPNSIVVSSTSLMMFTFSVPTAPYAQVQIYATGGGGASTVNYSLNYADATTTPATLSLPDWCVSNPGSGQYPLIAFVDRVQNGVTLITSPQCTIYALDLNPNPGKALQSVTFWDSGGGTTHFVFYGATAW